MKLKQTHVTYGLVTGIATIVFSALMLTMNVDMESGMQYLMYVIILIGLILNANAYAKANSNYVTYGNIYGSCFKAVLIIAAFSTVWGAVVTFAFPELKEEVLSKMASDFESKDTPEEQAQMVLDATDKYWAVTMIFGSLVGILFAGAILSLIAAAIPKKKGALPEHMQQPQ